MSIFFFLLKILCYFHFLYFSSYFHQEVLFYKVFQKKCGFFRILMPSLSWPFDVLQDLCTVYSHISYNQSQPIARWVGQALSKTFGEKNNTFFLEPPVPTGTVEHEPRHLIRPLSSSHFKLLSIKVGKLVLYG